MSKKLFTIFLEKKHLTRATKVFLGVRLFAEKIKSEKHPMLKLLRRAKRKEIKNYFFDSNTLFEFEINEKPSSLPKNSGKS